MNIKANSIEIGNKWYSYTIERHTQGMYTLKFDDNKVTFDCYKRLKHQLNDLIYAKFPKKLNYTNKEMNKRIEVGPSTYLTADYTVRKSILFEKLTYKL